AERYAYADPASHLLTLVTGSAGGVAIAYGATVTTRPVTADLGAALDYLAHPVDGVLAVGAEDLYTFAVRSSEIALPQGGAFLLAVDVQGAIAPALPVVEGLEPVVARRAAGSAFAIYRIATAGLFTLRVGGAGRGADVV